jgi:hypothetical protein
MSEIRKGNAAARNLIFYVIGDSKRALGETGHPSLRCTASG